ncbi:MAG: hypothetical protein ABI036_04255 [Fibrobacteria bacterium]
MKLLILKSALLLSALSAAGCFFGGESDSPTSIYDGGPKQNDTLPKVKKIVPGLYVGSYSEYDTSAQTIESELLLNADGSYRLFYIFGEVAFYDQSGTWFQKDSSLYFLNAQKSDIDPDFGIFPPATKLENDTNALVSVTDSSFRRLEYTPLRQKPYWISYKRKSAPALKEGTYFMEKTVAKDSVVADMKMVIDLLKGDFAFSYSESGIVTFQMKAKYSLAGTFLITENNSYRRIDTTDAFGEWTPLDGYSVQRLKSVEDTAFSMLSSIFGYSRGYWDSYSLVPK